MAYNFLGLVNQICGEVNEVPLTSSNFSGAGGFYVVAKDSINKAISQINQQGYHWPFNYIEQEDTLTAGINRYSIPYDAKSIDFNTFRIKRNNTFGNETRVLRKMDYEHYVQAFIDDEYNTSDTSIRGIPYSVAQAPGMEFVLHPVPDKNYELVYEYYMTPVPLELATDVPSIPEQYRHIIIDGAMYYVYNFRSDHENSQFMYGKFSEGIKNMKKTGRTRMEYVRDGRVNIGRAYQTALRTG